jgi:hypothetical protein
MEDLGITELESGHYTQMRLIIDTVPDDSLNILSQPHPFANYVIDQNDPPNEYELKIPSGLKTGIKIVGGFNISTNETTELILDFDACRSVVQAGNSGIWLLKPTIKILYQYTIINGLVTDDTDDKNPIEGALVSAQIYDDKGTSELADDEVVVQASTITDEKGEYKLLVPPGTYNLVAFAETDTETYLPDVIKISTSEGSTAKNFTLSIWPTGTVSGLVSISGATSEEHATLSFQQDANLYCPLPECGDIEKVEVKAINVANNSTYETNLPQGTFADGTEYFLVATSIGYIPFTEDFEVIDDGDETTVDVTVDVTLTAF